MHTNNKGLRTFICAVFFLIVLNSNAMPQEQPQNPTQKFVILEADLLKYATDNIAPIMVEFKMTFDEDKRTHIINRRTDFDEYYKTFEAATNLAALDTEQKYKLDQCKLLLRKMKTDFDRISVEADHLTPGGDYKPIYARLEEQRKVFNDKYAILKAAATRENRLSRMPPPFDPYGDTSLGGYVQDKIKKHLILMLECERKIERFK